jgi:Tfp pilus assembly PilM family ATPase
MKERIVRGIKMERHGGRWVIGVQLDLNALHAVAMRHGRIEGWIDAPFPPGMDSGSPEFPAFLQRSLAGFHAPHHRTAVWLVCPCASLQARFLTLPRVRPGQVSNLVYWTFRKEIPFDSVQAVFDYGVEGEHAEGSARKLDVTAYTVVREDLESAKRWFEQAGLPLEGVVLPSFALRNLFRHQWLRGEGTSVGLHVGDEASVIMFIRDRRVVAHRVFKTGLKTLLEFLRDRHPGWSHAEAFAYAREVLSGDPGVTDGTGAVPLPADAVKASLSRLIQQVERSLSAYMVGRNGEELSRLFVLGAITGLPGMVEEIGHRLGLPAEPADIFQPAHRSPACGDPVSSSTPGERALAAGAALSDPAHTPNLLHTYVDRERSTRRRRIRSLSGVFGGVAVIALLFSYAVVAQVNRGLNRELEGIRAGIAQFSPQPDEAMIRRMTAEAVLHGGQLREMAGRALPLAVQNRIAVHASPEIKLSMMRFRAKGPGTGAAPAGVRRGGAVAAAAGSAIGNVVLEGMVGGEAAMQESHLASFDLRLEDEPLFETVRVIRSEPGRAGSESVLLFTIEMNVCDLVTAPVPTPGPVAAGGVVGGGRP